MNQVKKFFIIIFSLVTVFVLYNFRTVPSGKLWNSYTVIYVPVSVDDSIMVDGFYNAGIEEFVCLSKQRVPVMFRQNSVERAMYNINFNSSDNEYLKRRENFFFDSARLFRLYYIPNEYKDKVNSFVKDLNKNGIAGGIDSSFAYPFFLPLIVLVFSFFLFVFTKKKSFMLIASLYEVLFVLCNPFYSCAIAALFFLITAFIVTNIWNREGAVKKIFHTVDFYIFVILSVLISFSNSIFSGLFYFMTVISVLGLYYLFDLREKEKYSKQTFTFILIRNARQTSMYKGKGKLILGLLSLAVVGIFVIFVLNSTKSFSGHFAKVLLPGESNITSKDLSTLNDYYDWTWKIKSAPYNSINTSNNSSTIVYPDYVKQDGKIKRIDRVIANNSDFKSSVYDDIDNLDFYSIEQVLKSQGKDSSYGYTASSSYSVSIITIILMILSVIMLLFLDISAIIKKGGRK